jgi:hypothetical protein
MLCLGKWSPPDEQHEDIDEEGLATALAPLTRLTRLHLKDCGLGAIPAEVGAPNVAYVRAYQRMSKTCRNKRRKSCRSWCSDTLHDACSRLWLCHRHRYQTSWRT